MPHPVQLGRAGSLCHPGLSEGVLGADLGDHPGPPILWDLPSDGRCLLSTLPYLQKHASNSKRHTGAANPVMLLNTLESCLHSW